MTLTGIRTFDHSVSTTQEWLADVRDEMGLADEDQACFVTRAVLHSLRDRLSVKEAADFAAQLPMLLQGLYYHGWTPADKPEKIRSKEEFLSMVSEKLMGRYTPQEATRAVFRVVEKRMTAGEIDDVKGTLPAKIQELWP